MAALPALLEVLPYDECLAYLGQETVGRMAWIRNGQPMLVPLNYLWDGHAIVLRSDPGRRVEETREASVAFEIDGFDAKSRTGWSVVVSGRLVPVDTTETRSDSGPSTWVPGSKEVRSRIEPDTVTGRRIRSAGPDSTEPAPSEPTNPYWRMSAYS